MLQRLLDRISAANDPNYISLFPPPVKINTQAEFVELLAKPYVSLEESNGTLILNINEDESKGGCLVGDSKVMIKYSGSGGNGNAILGNTEAEIGPHIIPSEFLNPETLRASWAQALIRRQYH